MFSYDEAHPKGPSKWCLYFLQSDGLRQSPINIDNRLVQKASYCNLLTVFNMIVLSLSIILENMAHGESVELNFANGVEVETFGGPLQTPHTLKNFRHYDGEIHLVQ